jgi:hypothetical protein
MTWNPETHTGAPLAEFDPETQTTVKHKAPETVLTGAALASATQRQRARANSIVGYLETAEKVLKRALDLYHEAEDAEEAGTKARAIAARDYAESIVRPL